MLQTHDGPQTRARLVRLAFSDDGDHNNDPEAFTAAPYHRCSAACGPLIDGFELFCGFGPVSSGHDL